MQLKKIEIQGFKSFADKTEIIFINGITTIVGPNGSGKSNISDAVRWVIGEQSVKSLRGSKMEDVIFSGTQLRKKVGFAEVSMFLDNSDGSLPVEYNEVVVTRRVYRTGESNYLMNGTECRLKDIQELFMDTGIGKDGYSIISQGKIDEILSTKSEERRHIFEEASGIVKYRSRKDEAMRKLSNTDITLSRVNDVLVEIENIIEPLEKKSQVAKKYLTLKEELKILDVRIFIQSLNQNAEDLKKLEDIIENFLSDIEIEEKNTIAFEKSKLNLKEHLQEISIKIEESQKKYFEVENETEKLNSSITVSNSDIQNYNQNVTRLENEILEDAQRIQVLEEELNTRLAKKENLENNKKSFETQLEEKQIELDEIVKSLDNKGLEIENLKKEIEEKVDIRYDLKVQNSSLIATIEANDKQINEKKQNDLKSISQKDGINAQKDDVYLEISKVSTELEQINKEETKLLDIFNEKNNYILSFNDKETMLKQEIMTLNSKYNYLVNLENENEGYYKSVKSALDYAKNSNISNVYGTLASVISTKDAYEYAIEIALGGYLQNILVEEEKEAKYIIEYLKKNSLGRVTFLPLNSIRKINVDSKKLNFEGFIGFASELVNFDKKYTSAINIALNNTIIVDNVDNAINISSKTKNQYKIVTLSGELIATTGSITGGQNAHKSSSLIGRQDKIIEIKKTIEGKEVELNNFYDKLKSTKDELVSIDEKLEKIKTIKSELSINMATLNEKYEGIKRELDKIESSKENILNILENLKNQNEQLQININKNNEQILQIDNFESKNKEIIDEYTRFNKQRQQEIDFLNEDIVNLKVSLSSFDESVSSIEEMKEKIQIDIDNFKQAIEKKSNQIVEFKLNIDNSNENISKLKSQIEEQKGFKNEFLKFSDKLKLDREESEEKHNELEVKMLSSVRQIERLKEEKSKVENKKVKFELEIDNLKNRMWNEYELTISSSKKLLEILPVTNESEKDIFKKAENIRKEIKDLGEVNVSAIEEYTSTKQRYDFISSQKEDLEQTKNKLHSLINNMTSIMKTQFYKQFKIISQNFDETFKELFGGGKAELSLSDESNVLESGIEIEVQPPGKKLQSMMLLSGGERALTAIALLFAILKIKSPPFCILDEIEAALDDVNVSRFADYIKKYSNNTQFIVITHRKGTMEVASSVYGVTMQEYGISKIVSMKLNNK